MLARRQLRRLHRARPRDAGGQSLLSRREPGGPDDCRRRPMAPLVECVPNFSEGRRIDVITAIADAIRESGGQVLDVQADAAHNRMVVTFVAEPDLAVEAAIAGAAVATERIDLRRHLGEHPRMGATDVVPFVPFADLPMSVCVDLARRFGSRLWTELRVPVYYYGEAATRPDRRELERVRRGGFEDLLARLGDPDRAPDEGAPTVQPSAGATAEGARIAFIASKVSLKTTALPVPELDQLADRLLELSQDDIDAYRAVIDARKSGAPAASLERAYERAAEVPLAAASAATRGLALAAETSRNAWDMTASDLSAGSELLQTGRDGALANVAINLPELRGEPAVRIERAYRELMAKA